LQHMAYEEQILDLLKTRHIISSRDLKERGLPTVYLSRMVHQGKLRKIGRGLYTLPDSDHTENQSLLEASQIAPNGVVCLLSALRYHELTTQNPLNVWLAIDRNMAIPRINRSMIRIMRYSRSVYTSGIETHRINGLTLKIYNPSKTIADCFKYRNKIGLDIALEALRDGWRSKKTTMDELWHYAKICRVSNVMRPYLETLV
jgi:predicted transcriptional regulator of viral defense system